MSYGLIALLIPGVLGMLFLKGLREDRREKEALRNRFLTGCGKLPWEYEAEENLGKKANAGDSVTTKGTDAAGSREETGTGNGLGNKIRGAAGNGPENKTGDASGTVPEFVIDEITWKELDMEKVFRRMDYTLSQAGTDYLYAALHHPVDDMEKLEKWDRAGACFLEHPEQRVRVQMLLHEIGKDKKTALHDCLTAMERMDSHKLIKEYAGVLAYIPGLLAAACLGGAGFFLLACVVMYQVVTYFQERAGILPYLRSIAWLLRMIRNLEKLYNSLGDDLRAVLESADGPDMGACIRKLKRLRHRSFWVMQCGRSGSSPLSLAGDYIRMLFHPDIIQFVNMQDAVRALRGEIEAGYAYIGFVDAGISIAMYRMSLEQYCIPELFQAKDRGICLETEGCVHPLLRAPVANGIAVADGRGVLLTGSNASGKSTFLKTVAVNLLLAQTVHTALAVRFSAPFCRIFTAMEDGGAIETGKSSYMAEILSLKRILDGGREPCGPVFCFVDEILRGTGTVERIAASTQILRFLRFSGICCFAATHDRELTRLLEQEYDNYYFTEEIREGDMLFPYRLLPGRADQNNAIRLLAAVGYDREIVERASRQAAYFLKEGVWK